MKNKMLQKIFNKNTFKQEQPEQIVRRRWDFMWEYLGKYRKRDFQSAVLYIAADQLFNAFETLNIWEVNVTPAGRTAKNLFTQNYLDVRYIIYNNFREIFFDLFFHGYFAIAQTPDKIQYVPAKFIAKITPERVYLASGCDADENADIKIFYDKDFIPQHLTAYDLLKNYLTFLDNTLEAASAGLNKLGNVSFLTPTPSDDGGEVLDDDTKKKVEKELQTNYGVMDDQSNICIMSHSFDLKTISFDFAKLQIDSNFVRSCMAVCGKLGIPYDLLPWSGKSTFDNQAQALKILYLTAERWVIYLQHIFEFNYNVAFDYELIGKPKEDAEQKENTNGKAIDNVTKLMQAGLADVAKAKEILSPYYDL